jgi:hypothetical protein
MSPSVRNPPSPRLSLSYGEQRAAARPAVLSRSSARDSVSLTGLSLPFGLLPVKSSSHGIDCGPPDCGRAPRVLVKASSGVGRMSDVRDRRVSGCAEHGRNVEVAASWLGIPYLQQTAPAHPAIQPCQNGTRTHCFSDRVSEDWLAGSRKPPRIGYPGDTRQIVRRNAESMTRHERLRRDSSTSALSRSCPPVKGTTRRAG